MLKDVLTNGANIFVIIVAVIIAFVAGLTTTDFLKTKEKEKKYEESDNS